MSCAVEQPAAYDCPEGLCLFMLKIKRRVRPETPALFARLTRSGPNTCACDTGPFLNFLALHEQRKLENPERLESLKMTFWPFAVAGGFL